MLERSVRIFQMKAGSLDKSTVQQMQPDDICFYRLIGGNPIETSILLEELMILKDVQVLVIGLFRFPFRFEGKKRQQTAAEQYYVMRDMADSVIYFNSDGMMEMIDPETPIKEAHIRFNIFEEKAIIELERLVDRTGEMNIDAKDILTFIKTRRGPLFFHSFEGENFDEPLKYAISAPYLPQDYADGEQMLINIGCTRGVNMESYKQMNLRLHDLFHKADLFKLGTYFIDEPGHKFRITLLINGIQDPIPRPENMKKVNTYPSKLKRKWKTTLQKGRQTVTFHQKHI